jgi:hypothetical protein
MSQKEIKLIETDPGEWTVIVGDRFLCWLGWDEALGVVASVLTGAKSLHLRTYAENVAYKERFGYCGKTAVPIALLPAPDAH